MSSGFPSVALQGPASPLSIQFMKSPSLFQMEKMRTMPRSRAPPITGRPPRRLPSVLLASQYSFVMESRPGQPEELVATAFEISLPSCM